MNADADPPATNTPGKLPPGCLFLVVGVIAVFGVAVFTGMILNPALRTRVPSLRQSVTQPQVFIKTTAEPFDRAVILAQARPGSHSKTDNWVAASSSHAIPPRVPQQK